MTMGFDIKVLQIEINKLDVELQDFLYLLLFSRLFFAVLAYITLLLCLNTLNIYQFFLLVLKQYSFFSSEKAQDLDINTEVECFRQSNKIKLSQIKLILNVLNFLRSCDRKTF